MKRSVAIFALMAASARWSGAEPATEFSNGDSGGWRIVSHASQSNPQPSPGITATDDTPEIENGFLLAQDLNDDWNYIAAPAAFLGSWTNVAQVKLGLVTDDAVTIYPLVLFLANTNNGVVNSASYTFPTGGTPGSSRLDLTAPVAQSAWTMNAGSWPALIEDVQQFWIRTDLNSTVVSEVDRFDYVRLVQREATELKIYRSVELEFFATAGVVHQLQISTDLESWKNYGESFVGDDSLHTEHYRVGDQGEVYFRVLRNP